jgi:hypothetical protein
MKHAAIAGATHVRFAQGAKIGSKIAIARRLLELSPLQEKTTSNPDHQRSGPHGIGKAQDVWIGTGPRQENQNVPKVRPEVRSA